MKKRFTKVLVALAVFVLILINPVPVIVSAAEDTAISIEKDLNLPSPVSENPPAQAQTPAFDAQKLNKYISVEASFLGLTDNLSVYFKDLNSGSSFSISPDKSWIPASIIKAFVAAEAFHQRHEGIINFNTPVTIVADNVVPNPLESDEFPRLREGTQATIGQLVQAMIIQSDNTAYNTLLDVLDRRSVESYVKSLGIENTIVGEKLNVDDNQQRRDSVNPGYQFNVTTAGDYSKLFDLMYAHKIPDSDELISIFKRQKFDSMIPSMIPSVTPVAHKTGEWAPIYHDGGIVYKPESPFILALFSNSNNPSDLAKLAQIAYYQDVNHVDTSIVKPSAQKQANKSLISRIYLADSLSANDVLAASTSVGNSITAADLGITPNDLSTTSVDQSTIPYTLITPASLLYKIKLYIEDIELSQASDSQKPAFYLKFAKERLSEIKSISGFPNESYIESLNSNFQNNLGNAAELAQKSSDKNELLLNSKQLSDLHFMVLGASAARIDPSQKENFINNAFQTLTQNDKQVAPIIKNSPLALASKSEPVVGTIQSIKDMVATVTADNGKNVEVNLSDATKVRGFNDRVVKKTQSLKEGDKIAIVGQFGGDGKITPVFIMSNLPKTLPKTKGVVVEIQPESNLIKIENGSGQIQNVKIDSSTSIQAKDTGVSLEGIKAGSVITVVGQTGATPIPSTNSSSLTSSTINAKSVTINVNGSGKTENVEKKPAPKKAAPKNPEPPMVPPKKEDNKTQQSPTPSK